MQLLKQVKILSGEVTFDINSYLCLSRFVKFIDRYKYIKKQKSGTINNRYKAIEPLITMKEKLTELSKYKPEMFNI